MYTRSDAYSPYITPSSFLLAYLIPGNAGLLRAVLHAKAHEPSVFSPR
jgi:hypothetical protein